ncbi:hypothetical protein AN958_08811 [Leucoagaricus sp. SymC.cos]|nr:hypothetical protein AN958_08811 [Leucoagaricus sp. SymC.cos]
MSQSGGTNLETGLSMTHSTQLGQHRVYVMRSDDDGVTFEGMDGSLTPTGITATLTPKTRGDGSAWAWDVVGPGAGLYTSDGVIIIPAQFRNIYSKDHGKTCINGGFSAYEPDNKPLDPEDEISVLFYNNAESDAPSRTIFLNSGTTTRTEMRFRISYNNAKTWPMCRPLSNFTPPSGSGTEGGYSSMVKTADKNIGVMVETNLDISNNDVSARGILWHKLNLTWILHTCAC